MLRKLLLNFLLACLFNNRRVNAFDVNPIIDTPLGAIKGSVLTSVLGKSIYSFRGIRYAKAPVDELRFQPPVAVDEWKYVYDATQDGAMCPQPRFTLLPISEDCLFLNVYSTELPVEGLNPKRPVYVHFHSGGFYSVSGASRWAGPEYFMDQDIVLVTPNYRLGSLGFLSTGDSLAPGNNGLKDQVVVLRWVRDNIAAFGGDPNLVTIGGYSAGSMSVTMHLVSPMSQGLFHRAVPMSGSVYANWPITTNQFDLAQKQARFVGCPDDTSDNIINCLKSKSAKEIGNSLLKFYEYRLDPMLIWKPVIEPDCGQERFLPDHPVKLAQSGQFAKVPVMTGITKDEFANAAFGVIKNSELLTEMDENFEEIAPIAFLYERNTNNSRFISKHLREFYLGEGPLNSSSVDAIGRLYADGVIGFGGNRFAKLLAANNSEPVYYYLFSYQGRYSHFYVNDTEIPYGVVHHDDLIYMFYISAFPKFNVTDPEYKTVKKLTTLLSNFAYTGKPIPEPVDELDNVEWNPFNSYDNNYLDIGDTLVVRKNLYQDRYALWEKLFPLP